MDYHTQTENKYRIEHPSVGRSPKDNREVQGIGEGWSYIPHAEQYHLQQDTEKGAVRQDTVGIQCSTNTQTKPFQVINQNNIRDISV